MGRMPRLVSTRHQGPFLLFLAFVLFVYSAKRYHLHVAPGYTVVCVPYLHVIYGSSPLALPL